MSRIIAGLAGGLRLSSVPGNGTRPTTDRVKESLFARLEAWGMLDCARVLDLFAGSGALGCEAASRGAARVDLVEREAKALKVCQANARLVNDAVGRADKATVSPAVVTVHRSSVRTFLASGPHQNGGPRALRQRGPWDLVLADPPYPLGEAEVTETLSGLVGRLGPGGVVVIERSARSPEPTWPQGLQLLEVSAHGETTLWFAEAACASHSGA